MKGHLVNILEYRTCSKSREELWDMFSKMKTGSTEPDRFHYVRCWHGTNELPPVVLTDGLVAIAPKETITDSTTDTEVVATACGQLEESIQQ